MSVTLLLQNPLVSETKRKEERCILVVTVIPTPRKLTH